jgi:hypothetical protein
MSKHVYKIYPNTDAVDIDSKCLGLSVILENDSEVPNNRGLHVQIRHNRDRETFEIASHMSKLFASAPELLEALEHCVAYFEKYKPQYCGLGDDKECSPYNDAVEAIKKAKGK